MAKASIKTGDVVRPANDGEDWAGRILKNTKARLRVTAAYEMFGENRIDVVVVRPGGMWKQGGRIREEYSDRFIVVDDVR